MEKMRVGRPPKEYGISKTGRLFTLWLEEFQIKSLDNMAKELNQSKAEIVRNLINQNIVKE